MSEEDYPQAAYIPRDTHMSKKLYFRVNIAKFVVELMGTAMMGIFYLLLAHS